jgi:hypothetical protein
VSIGREELELDSLLRTPELVGSIPPYSNNRLFLVMLYFIYGEVILPLYLTLESSYGLKDLCSFLAREWEHEELSTEFVLDHEHPA